MTNELKETKDVGPSMFDPLSCFGGIVVRVDPIDRERNERSDNVMAMFYEEQPFMWEYVKGDIARTIEATQGEIDFLDVGTGSGVWSLLVARNTSAKHIVAIDKNPRAIQQAKQNADTNGLNFSVREEFYNINTARYRSVKVIGLYPPYHLYPSEIEMKIPQHARGGIDGQQILKEQLITANYHLAENGIIVFNQMCLGREGSPEFVRYIPVLVDDVSLTYTNIFPPMNTDEFLREVYGAEFAEYRLHISSKYPELYYCDGIIRRNGRGQIQEISHSIPLKGRTWQDRSDLHRQIALHGLDSR